MTVLRRDAAFKYTVSGQEYWHRLATPLQRPSLGVRQRVDVFTSEDYTTQRRIALGSGVHEVAAAIRHDGNPESLLNFLTAAKEGASVEYVPSLARGWDTFPVTIVNADRLTEAVADRETWWDNRHEFPVRLRRTDGGSLARIVNRALFYYRAGQELDGTFTRSGAVGPYVDPSGVIQAAAANILRNTWIDGVGPRTLIEDERTNLITDDDLTNWTTGTGTPTVAGSIDDPAGGTDAYRITDNAAGIENIYFEPSFTGDGMKGFYVVWRDLSVPASGCTILVEDQSGPSSKALLNATWSNGVPTINAIVGTHFGTVHVGGGWYVTFGRTTSVTAANTHRVYLTPAATGSHTGVMEVYRVGVFDEAVPSFSILNASGARNAETFYLPYTASALEPLTLYLKFRELGSIEESLSTLLQIGGGSGSGYRLDVYNNAGTYKFYVANQYGEDEVGTGLTQPTWGDDVEIRCVLTAEMGLTMGMSVNGAAEETSSNTPSYVALPPSWEEPRMYLGSRGSDRRCPAVAYDVVKVAPGAKSIDYMRGY